MSEKGKNKQICGHCKHWKDKRIELWGEKNVSFGKCKVLSKAGFETFTSYDSTCDDYINYFEEKREKKDKKRGKK